GLVYATLSPDGKWLYAGGQDSAVPVNVALTPPRPQPAIAVGGSGGDNQIAFSPDGSTAWVTSPGGGTVSPIDVATQAIGAPIPTGLGASGVVVSPDGKTLWVANGNADTSNPVDTVSQLSISGSGTTATATKVKDVAIGTGDPDSLAITR